MSLIEQIKEVMGDHTGPAHVSEIADMIIERFPNTPDDRDKLINKISSVLAADARKPGAKASFSKPKNKQGGHKRGWYRLKRKPDKKPTPTIAPNVSTQYTGKAGESAVMSELLFYGYNVSAMTVDEGIDLIAEKQNNYFHIQVKTANPSASGAFGFKIKKSSFKAKHSAQTFYIFVLRDFDGARYFNDYVILPSNQVALFRNTGVINDGSTLSINIQKDTKGRYMLNAKFDATILINTFGQIG